MARYEVAPTKTNLLRLKNELEFTQEGYELLDQKRSILIVELMALVSSTESLQNQLEVHLKKSFESLLKAIQSEGWSKLEFIASTINIKSEIKISLRKVMGVSLPVVNIQYKDNPPYYNLFKTSFMVDETIFNFKKTLEIIGKLAELRISLMKLAYEVKKTIRRVNALEKIAIPDYKETIKFIDERLEEAERNSFFLMKLVKKRLEKK